MKKLLLGRYPLKNDKKDGGNPLKNDKKEGDYPLKNDNRRSEGEIKAFLGGKARV